jgi:hypothetical protein
MKQQLVQSASKITRKAFTATLILSAFLGSFLPFTGFSQGQYLAKNNNPVIRYLGVLEDKLIFQIDLNGAPNDKLLVSIKDDDGNLLFSERVKDQKFSRKVAIEKEMFEGRKVMFIIQGAKESSEQTFQVSRNTRLVEDVVVARQ